MESELGWRVEGRKGRSPVVLLWLGALVLFVASQAVLVMRQGWGAVFPATFALLGPAMIGWRSLRSQVREVAWDGRELRPRRGAAEREEAMKIRSVWVEGDQVSVRGKVD